MTIPTPSKFPFITPVIFSTLLPECVSGVLLALLVSMVAGCSQAAGVSGRTTVLTRPTTSPAEQRELARAKDLFYLSVAGERENLPAAEQTLNELGGGNSADPRVIAYAGAAKLLQAAHAPNFFEKARLGREGMDLEDKAVAQASDDLEVRFLRGVSLYQLPAFMGRRQQAVSDLAYVAGEAEAAARSGRLDRRAAAADLVYYGKTREEAYDAAGAVAAWRAAVRIAPDSQAGRDALKHLAEHDATSLMAPGATACRAVFAGWVRTGPRPRARGWPAAHVLPRAMFKFARAAGRSRFL